MGVKAWQLFRVDDGKFFEDVFIGQPAMYQLEVYDELMYMSYEEYNRLISLSVPTEIGGALYELRCFDIIVGEG